MIDSYLYAIIGGLLIGTSATLLLLFNGRIAGISGITWGMIADIQNSAWRIAFLLGLPLGAFVFHLTSGIPYPLTNGSFSYAIGGGFLVGLGVKLGGGCTSGHGVCGIGRLSLRSLVATCTFVFTAMITVYIARHML